MTLVANFDIRNWPVLVGDIMLSMPRPGLITKPFHIPTSWNVNARLPATSKRIVSGVVQKVTLLNPRLALGWAGSSICARSVFRDILQQNSPPTFRDVKNVLNERQGEAGMDLYVTGISLEGVRGEAWPITRFAWDSVDGWEGSKQAIPGYGNCFAGGTGADVLLHLLSNSKFSMPEQTLPIESAICLSLGHLGALAGDQMRSGAGLQNFFGGAFEMVTLLADQLQKIGDVTYHFWEAKSAPNDDATLTIHASMRIAYFEDYLVIRKLVFGAEVADTLGADEVYIILPVHRTVDDAEKARVIAAVPRPSMNARFSVFYVDMPEKRATQDAHVFVHKAGTPGKSPMIAFEEGEDGLEMQIDAEVFQRVRRALTA